MDRLLFGETYWKPVVPPSPTAVANVVPPTFRSNVPESLAGIRDLVTLTFGFSLFVTTHVTGAVTRVSAFELPSAAGSVPHAMNAT